MTFLSWLIVLALLSTLVSLGWGIVSMAHGGAYNKKHSAQLMSARVGLQALTIILLLIAFYFALV